MKARGDASTPPIGNLYKPIYVLQMNWWHWSDETRTKWLRKLRTALQDTIYAVDKELARLNPRKLCTLDHHRGISCPNKKNGCTW